MTRRRSLAALAAAALTAAILPAGAGAQVPEPQSELVDPLSICPAVPNLPDCYHLPIPGEVWATAAVVPLREGEDEEEQAEIEAAYDSLIPEPFFPIEGRREIAVLMFRMNIPPTVDQGIDDDPGAGYAEGTVGIRVGFPAEDGYPFSEGWWVIAQPLNDSGQHGSGRDIGLPKYMADAGVRIGDDGGWTAWANDWGLAEGQSRPGRSLVEGGNVLELTWTADAPDLDGEQAHDLWRWGMYDHPLFVQKNPYDESGPHDAGLVKFTPFSLVPVRGLPMTPLTNAPDPRLGTATVRLEGVIPNGPSFADIVEPGVHTVAGTSAYTRGGALMTVDNLENRKAD